MAKRTLFPRFLDVIIHVCGNPLNFIQMRPLSIFPELNTIEVSHMSSCGLEIYVANVNIN